MKHSKEIIGIQYLRGLAASAVLVQHTSGLMAEDKYFGQQFLPPVPDLGDVGVSLFFVISGFIMVHIALKPGHLAPATTVADFFRRRFLRILPFMWACILAWIFLRILGRGLPTLTENYPAYLRALTLWPIGLVDPPPVWTLRHELLFYLLFGLALLPGRLRFMPLLIWIALPLLLRGYHYPIGALLRFLASEVNLFFGAGILCGVLSLKRPNWFGPWRGGGLLSLCLCLLAATGHAFLPKGNVFIALGLDAICIYVAIRGRPFPGMADRIARLLGDASFSIYLTHLIFVAATFSAVIPLHVGAPVAFVLAIVISLAGGIAVHRYGELPLLRALRARRSGSVVLAG